MASKGIDSNTSRVALLPPTLARDNLGVAQSLHHLRKPLADYDLSCFDLATGTGASLSTGLVTD